MANSGNNQRWKLILKTAPVARQALATGADGPGTAGVLEIYPNPAADHATLQYELRQPAPVRLEVLDGLGRRVALLADGEPQAAGPHQAVFSTQALPSGMYRVVLRAGPAVQSRSLLLVR